MVRHALIDYGFSREVAETLIDELVNPTNELPIKPKRYGVMETREGGSWVVWDRQESRPHSGLRWPTEHAAQERADAGNAPGDG